MERYIHGVSCHGQRKTDKKVVLLCRSAKCSGVIGEELKMAIVVGLPPTLRGPTVSALAVRSEEKISSPELQREGQ